MIPMIYLRIISFIIVVLVALFLPMWAFGISMLTYVLVFGPYELLILAVCIDAQFGDRTMSLWYSYTALTVLTSLCTIRIRPYLSMYE